jgi:uncharacterized protein HemX
MDITDTIAKYTGHHLSWQELLAPSQANLLRRQLTQALESAAVAVSHTETELQRVTASITDSLTTVSQNLTAGPATKSARSTRSVNCRPTRHASTPSSPAATPKTAASRH